MRRFVGSRLPLERAELLVAAAKADGISVSEFVDLALKEKLESHSYSQLERQEVLPLGRIAS